MEGSKLENFHMIVFNLDLICMVFHQFCFQRFEKNVIAAILLCFQVWLVLIYRSLGLIAKHHNLRKGLSDKSHVIVKGQ